MKQVTDATRHALLGFATLPLGDTVAYCEWIVKAYCPALVGPLRSWLPMIDESDQVVAVQQQLVVIDAVARSPSGNVVARLPKNVHVARVEDWEGSHGFAALDVPRTPLCSRVMSLFLVDYLMNADEFCAAELRHASGTQLRAVTGAVRTKKSG